MALASLVVVLSRENRDLRAQIDAIARRVPADALKPGETVTPLEMIGAAGAARRLSFGDGAAPTVVFMIGAQCGYCEDTIPRYAKAVSDAGAAGLRVVCIQFDAGSISDLKPTPPALPAFVVPDGRGTWLGRVPMVPAAVVINPKGVVQYVWFGQMDDAQADALLTALLEVASQG